MTKPAIIHIITKLDLGGAQKSCLALVKELQLNHPDFEIYFISGTKGPLATQAKQLNNTYLLDTMLWEINPKNIFIEIKNFFQLIKIIRKLKLKHPQLTVHTHTIKAGVVGRWAAVCAGVKTRIHTIHGFGFNPYQNKLIWLVFYLIELVNSIITTHFICVSSQDLKAGSEIFPNFSKKSSIIRAATLSQKQFYPAKKSNSTFKIGTIACLKTGKNLIDLLKIIKWVKKRHHNIKLEIIGDGPLKPILKAYIAKNNLVDNVKLLGWIAEPVKYAKDWDLFVFTSLWEGLPCAVVEMADIGIPILSYQVGGINDLVHQSQLHPTGKWLNLAKNILEICKYDFKRPSKKPPIEFYIPNMALDHAILYNKTHPFDS
jgi:glycosyltransferase involved in cell wall biosynthesis